MAAGGDEGAKGGGGEGKTYTWPRGLLPPESSCLLSDWSDATVRRDKESLASLSLVGFTDD
jgi:hypothetical protein